MLFRSPETIARDAARSECATIAYTYTEPTIYFEYAIDTAVHAHELGIKNVFVTNGYETPGAIDRMKGLIDAANVDLKSYSDDFYKKQCGARLEPVLESIGLMHEAGIHVEVTTLVIPGLNDSGDELRQIARFLAGISPDMGWHVSRFHPDFEMHDRGATPEQTIRRAVEIGREEGLNYIWAGNLPGRGNEDSICRHCGETVIVRTHFSVNKVCLEGNGCAHCGARLAMVVE